MITTLTHRLKSYVRRGGRGTVGQARAQDMLGPVIGLRVGDGMLDCQKVFGRSAPCYLEIGFGSGHSLLTLAKSRPADNFIGVEPHKPGIGTLYMGMQQQGVTNIRVYDADVVDVLASCIAPACLDGVMIFFPDPWQKRRHHPRRLVQTAFVMSLIDKLKPGGVIHLATDWEDYAIHMLRVLSSIPALRNLNPSGGYGERSSFRPVVTKFERRALREGRVIRELQFKIDNFMPVT